MGTHWYGYTLVWVHTGMGTHIGMGTHWYGYTLVWVHTGRVVWVHTGRGTHTGMGTCVKYSSEQQLVQPTVHATCMTSNHRVLYVRGAGLI